jgi:hypothetical protein
MTLNTPGVDVWAGFIPAQSPDAAWRIGEGAAHQNRVYLVLDAPVGELENYSIAFGSGAAVPFRPAIPADKLPPAPSPDPAVALRSVPRNLPTEPSPPRDIGGGSPRSFSAAPTPAAVSQGSGVAAGSYAVLPSGNLPKDVPAGAAIVGHGGRGNLRRFDEAWEALHANEPDYRLALQLLRQNILDNPSASDLDYDLGWGMFAAAKASEWEAAADYYEALRKRGTGEFAEGAEGAQRDWNELHTEVKTLADRAASTSSRKALQRMRMADRLPTTSP